MTEDDQARVHAPTVWAAQTEVRAGAHAWFMRAMIELAQANNLLFARIGQEQTAELPRPREDEEESAHSSDLFKSIRVAAEWTIATDDVIEFRIESFLEALLEVSIDYAGQITKGMMEHLDTVLEASGQVVDGAGRNFYDVLPEVIDKLEIDFDENGEHNTSIVIHPDTAKKLAETKATPEQEARINEAWARKRRQSDATRRRRELPGITH